MGIGDFFDLNRYAKYFRVGRFSEDLRQKEAMYNSQGLNQEQIDLGIGLHDSSSYNYYGDGGANEGGMSSINIQFEQYFVNKAQRVGTYHAMSFYPEISDALDIICDDAICEDVNGNIVNLEFKEELPEHIEDIVNKEWDYIVNDVFSFNETAWDLFRRWVIDGELYLELILNNEGNNILDIKRLPSHTMIPIYSSDNSVEGYIQTVKPINFINNEHYLPNKQDQADDITFDKNQVVYVNYGEIGRNKYDTRGFLESSVRIYNQLKHLEDAVVIYRIVRAPERRIWNVNVGRMPKSKAEEYLRNMIQRYRKKFKYDSLTGAMDSSQNILAMVEDFWFPVNQDGQGTSVDVLQGGQNLGEMEDVNYFLKKLYKNLKLPSSRWGGDETNIYSNGKSGEITREEIKFARFVERLQKKFKYLLLDAFITQLRLKGIDKKYISYSLYNVTFTETNIFKKYKELELLSEQFALLGSIEAYIYKPEENENGYFDPEFVLRKWFMMSDEDYNLNKKLLDRRKEAAEKKREEMGGQEGGLGGFGGEEDGEAPTPTGGGFGGGPVAGGGFGEPGEEGGEVSDEEDIASLGGATGFGDFGGEAAEESFNVKRKFGSTNKKNSILINEFINLDNAIIENSKKNKKEKL